MSTISEASRGPKCLPHLTRPCQHVQACGPLPQPASLHQNLARCCAFSFLAASLVLLATRTRAASNVLLEAEAFTSKGGWVVDPQFVEQMGSRFLLAHGGGTPVADASTTDRKTVTLPEAKQVTLDLGEVVASAEVRVNGQPDGIKLAPPWTLDITSFVKPGANRIEVLVRNTLANHYTTVPTQYRGATVSGLLGPVHIELR